MQSFKWKRLNKKDTSSDYNQIWSETNFSTVILDYGWNISASRAL